MKGMRERGDDRIGKFELKESIFPVVRALRRKPVLLLPFLFPIILSVVSISVKGLIMTGFREDWLPDSMNGVGELFYPPGAGYIGLVYLWNIIMLIVSFFAGIILSAWEIQSYWAYFRLDDVSMKVSFRKGMTFFKRMLCAKVMVILILYIPINLVQLIWWMLITGHMGVEDHIIYDRLVMVPMHIYSYALSALFIFIYQGIIIEKEGVLGSLKRSFKVSTRNYWKVLLISLFPLIAGLPFTLVSVLLWRPGTFWTEIVYIIDFWIPAILLFLLAPIVSYSLTRGYILSVKGRRGEYGARFRK